MNEIPTPQTAYSESRVLECARHAGRLSKMLEGILQPEQIHTAIDLYCGQGIWTSMIRAQYPEVRVYSVDFHNVLISSLLSDSNVIFNQGYVSEVMAQPEFPFGDLVIIGNSNRLHGFNENNIHLLHDKSGVLITDGDNARLEEQKFFQQAFQLIRGNAFEGNDRVWKSR
jgi:hypothetical protein